MQNTRKVPARLFNILIGIVAILITSGVCFFLFKTKIDLVMGTQKLERLREDAAILSGDIVGLSGGILELNKQVAEKTAIMSGKIESLSNKNKAIKQLEDAIYYMNKANQDAGI